VCGGGRYDGLIEQIGGKAIPGVGFGMGLERVLMLMEAVNAPIPEDNGVTVYFASMGEKAYYKAFELAYALRNKGVSAETDHMNRSLKAQFKYADKIGAKYVAVIGSSELESGVVKLKNMTDGSEENIAFSELVNKEF
jgi:histidyl-tRNA synthetase